MKPTNLVRHPEGGRFEEVFRSASIVTTSNGVQRSALTHIYFSLDSGDISRFHKVSSDEIWNLYRGTGIKLHLWDDTNAKLQTITLSAETNTFCSVVPAGVWQAAEPLDEAVLAGCSVAPGFEFVDFEMMDASSEEARSLRSNHPELTRFIPGF